MKVIEIDQFSFMGEPIANFLFGSGKKEIEITPNQEPPIGYIWLTLDGAIYKKNLDTSD